MTAVVSALAFNFFHIPPTGRFTIADGENWVALAIFLAVVLLASSVADLARARTAEACERRREADLAAEMARGSCCAPTTCASRSRRRCDWHAPTMRRSCPPIWRRFHALDAALPLQCELALPLLEAVEQQATGAGVAVDARIERGRSHRHALTELVGHESYDRIVVPPARTAARASPPRTSPGCCARSRASWSSCVPIRLSG